MKSNDVLLSNKLGWLRAPLKTPEPTFEPGVWKNLRHDARQSLGYQGILDCWEQGCELLTGYKPALLSVHDPDEYLAQASSSKDRANRFDEILDSYRALADLKAKGEAKAVGVGSKDWRVIREIDAKIKLDWVMFANSLTVYSHPADLADFMSDLAARGVGIVNSAVFHGGFLTGGDFFDYRPVSPDTEEGRLKIRWRSRFQALCAEHGISPAVACVQFGLTGPGVRAIALNTGKPERVKDNVDAVLADIPETFWTAMKNEGLLRADYALEGKAA